jgi:peptide/nickel transport system substrate-binding protein
MVLASHPTFRTESQVKRRTLLHAGTATLAVGLARPSIVRAAGARVLKFIPQADLAVLDPVWTTAYVTRTHGMMVFDTLYGSDANFQPQPQMIEGAQTGADGKEWKLTLRDGLKFHEHTGAGARLCCLHPALGQARCLRAGADGGHR